MTTGSTAPQPNDPAAPQPDEPVIDHEYDGIREYDNPMPRWWVNIFWASFLFSVGYFFHFHLSKKGDGWEREYALEMQEHRAAEAARALGDSVSEASLGKLMADTAMMKDAREIYAQRCAACHADQGQGLIGPNLTDDYWVHGDGSLMAIHQVVSDGVPAKGMPAWSRQLTPVELRTIVAFVGSLRGKNVAGKAPEGNKIGAVVPTGSSHHASAPSE